MHPNEHYNGHENYLLKHMGDGQECRLAGEPPRFAIGIGYEIPEKGRIVVDPGIRLGIETIGITRCILGWQSTTWTIEHGLGKLVVPPGPREEGT